MTHPIRVGVFGVGRGQSFAQQAAAMEGVRLVALCDMREGALKAFAEQIRHSPQAEACGFHGKGIATYTDYDRFLEHDMDAVVLANYATEHAPAGLLVKGELHLVVAPDLTRLTRRFRARSSLSMGSVRPNSSCTWNMGSRAGGA